jgi:hypothetical protein
MRKPMTAAILGGGAIAVSLGLGANTALATAQATWTVSPGGALSASGPGQVKDVTTGTVAKCSSIKMSGTLKSGSGLSGTGIGSVKSASFTGCKIATISVTVKVGKGSLPWQLNALTYNSATKTVTGSIKGLDLVATAPGCSATLDGTAAGANNGLIKFSYSDSTGKLKLLGSGGNLHSWAVSGCFGLVSNGDAQQASGTLPVTPKQNIHSP